jgi:signal transduction histidine kinase
LSQDGGHLVSAGGEDPRLRKNRRYRAFLEGGGGSLILAPLHAPGQRLGIMMVGSRAGKRIYDSADTDLLEAIANQIALVLDHTSLLTREYQRLQEIVDAIPEGILLFDRQKPHTVRRANAVACRNLAIDHGALAGQPLPVENLGLGATDLSELQDDIAEERAELHRADGTSFWARLSVRPASVDRRSALLAAFVDIEDQKRAEAAAERLDIETLRAMFETEQPLLEQEPITNTKLREVDRLKSSMLRNMSHELRTPLNSILGFAQILAQDLDDTSLKPLAEMIDLSGQRLMDTLNSVLDLARLEGGAFELSPAPVDLVALANEARSLFSPQARRAGLALICSADQPKLLASADPAAPNRVLANLVSNAIRFTPRGTVSLHLRSDGDQAVLAVSDTGVGIESAKGVGSTFTVRLPLWKGWCRTSATVP